VSPLLDGGSLRGVSPDLAAGRVDFSGRQLVRHFAEYRIPAIGCLS
jgi:hypothetical protein